ncbi:MAG: MoaD/ThiS family protein [Anaerolineales bacterium]|nr:MoaD/ThiS family protein [Anaerolineales bacterium]
MIRVVIPYHLQNLAGVSREVTVQVEAPVTLARVLDTLEAQYPVLRGTIRDHVTKERRAFIRFFTCGEDWSHESVEMPLPAEVTSGAEPLRIVGAIAGG